MVTGHVVCDLTQNLVGENFLNYCIDIHCDHMQVCVCTLDWRVSKEGGLGLFWRRFSHRFCTLLWSLWVSTTICWRPERRSCCRTRCSSGDPRKWWSQGMDICTPHTHVFFHVHVLYNCNCLYIARRVDKRVCIQSISQTPWKCCVRCYIWKWKAVWTVRGWVESAD